MTEHRHHLSDTSLDVYARLGRELRQQPDQVCELLEAAERAGFAAATQLLDLWGLRWMPGKTAPKYPPPPDDGRREVVQLAVMQGITTRLKRPASGSCAK